MGSSRFTRPRAERRRSRPAVARAQAVRAEARRTRWRSARSDEGFAMSSPLAMVAALVVAAAGVGFFATEADRVEQQQTREAALVTAPAPEERPVTLKKRPKPKPKPVERSEVYAEVYNNSNITGLAGSVTARMSGLGWQVVTTDNWYGTIPASTVYYPERLERAAELLSDDLGIERVQPAIAPMSLDRLTVVLTADYA